MEHHCKDIEGGGGGGGGGCCLTIGCCVWWLMKAVPDPRPAVSETPHSI